MKRRKLDLVVATLASLFLVGALAVESLAANENWSPAGDLTLERNSHVATLLADGRVLVTGGYSPSAGNGGYNVQTAEIYEPATNFWFAAGSTANGRNDHAAVKLANGKVLVAGGVNANICASDVSSELYDPVSGTWSLTGNIPFATTGLTLTLLNNGKVLLAGGGNRCGGVFSGAALYDPVAGTWSPTGSMTQGREWHSAVLLSDGRVLVAGGLGSSSPFPALSSAEIYDPATGLWTATGSMITTRFGSVVPFLTRLSDGRVLAAAGSSGNGFSSSPNGPQAELYDPVAGTWTATGSMSVGRAGGTFSLLADGKILAAGGSDASPATHSSAELYDPATGTWSLTASLLTARSSHAAAVLADGRVLVVAGYDSGNYFTSAEVYGPVNWSPAGNLTLERNSHVATLLATGRVLVTGGYSPSAGNGGYNVQTAELYDPGTNSWSTTGSTANGRNDHAAAVLANTKVLVAGGVNANICASDVSSELYDPTTGTWSFTGNIPFATTGLTMTTLSNGKVLLAGGGNRCGGVFSSAAVYDPTAGTWSPTGSMTQGREWHSAVLLGNGKVLVAGGLGSSSPFPALSSAEIYDPTTGTWAATGSMATTRFGSVTPFLTRLSDGRAMAAAGYSGNGFSSGPNGPQVEIYDPATGTWSPTGSMSVGRAGGTFSLLPDGKILAAGGSDATPATHSSSELWDPNTGAWSMTASLLTARTSHAATVLFDGRVLAVGGYDAGNYFTSAEIYGPAVYTANLGIVKTDPPTRAPTGQNRTYTITVTNSGPETAYGVTVTDTLPGSVTFVSATPSQGNCVRSGVIVTCYLGSIASGGNATVSLVVKPTVAGVITNVASVTTSSRDPDLENNTDSENTTVCRITSRPTSIPCP